MIDRFAEVLRLAGLEPVAEEIADALSVAISLNAGAALVYSARVMDAVQAYEKA